jgi:hypothetical protein
VGARLKYFLGLLLGLLSDDFSGLFLDDFWPFLGYRHGFRVRLMILFRTGF